MSIQTIKGYNISIRSRSSTPNKLPGTSKCPNSSTISTTDLDQRLARQMACPDVQGKRYPVWKPDFLTKYNC